MHFCSSKGPFPSEAESVESSESWADEIIVSGRNNSLSRTNWLKGVNRVRLQHFFQFRSRPDRLEQPGKSVEAGFQATRQCHPIRRPLRRPASVRSDTAASTVRPIRWPILKPATGEFRQQPDTKRLRRPWSSPPIGRHERRPERLLAVADRYEGGFPKWRIRGCPIRASRPSSSSSVQCHGLRQQYDWPNVVQQH